MALFLQCLFILDIALFKWKAKYIQNIIVPDVMLVLMLVLEVRKCFEFHIRTGLLSDFNAVTGSSNVE